MATDVKELIEIMKKWIRMNAIKKNLEEARKNGGGSLEPNPENLNPALDAIDALPFDPEFVKTIEAWLRNMARKEVMKKGGSQPEPNPKNLNPAMDAMQEAFTPEDIKRIKDLLNQQFKD